MADAAKGWRFSSHALLVLSFSACVGLAADVTVTSTIQAAVNALCSTTNCTLLAIAHRLDTVIDMDQILVMADGEVAEYGAPQELLRVPGGAFAALAARAGVGFPQTRIVSMQSS